MTPEYPPYKSTDVTPNKIKDWDKDDGFSSNKDVFGDGGTWRSVKDDMKPKKTREPRRGCKKCFGGGTDGRDYITKEPILCRCMGNRQLRPSEVKYFKDHGVLPEEDCE